MTDQLNLEEAATEESEVVNGEVVAAESAETALAPRPTREGAITYTSLQGARDWPALLALAEGMHRSRIGVPASLKTPEAVATVLLAGNEDGLGPIEALTELHVINGRVGRSANLMRKLVYKRIPGAVIHDVEIGPERVILEGQRPGKPPCRVEWTADDARKAKLDKKDNWVNYAEDMLYARATGRLCRRYFPDAFSSPAYTPEELADEPIPPSPAPAANGNAPHAPSRRAPQGPPAPPVSAPPESIFDRAEYKRLVTFWQQRHPGEKRKDFIAWANGNIGPEAHLEKPENWSLDCVNQLEACLQ